MIDKWHNCYDDSWQGIIVPEAFSHPAKMAHGLTKKIFKHALSESWIKPGDIVVDPFGGIGSTGIIGASLGLRVVCVELEEKFVALGKQNFELNRKAFECSHFGHAYQPVIIQGDSRQLYGLLRVASILSEKVIAGVDCVISSPPYSGTRFDGTITKNEKFGGFQTEDYGRTPGQLGAMKSGSVDAVVSSPPYAETLKGDGTQKETAAESRAKRVTPGGSLGQSQRTQGYGSKGNLGNLKPGIVSSPPYATGSIAKNSSGIDRRKQWETYRASGGGLSYEGFAAQQEKHSQEYGETPGQLQNLKPGEVDAVVSSPPYEGSLQSGCPESKWELIQKCIRDGKGHASKKLAPSVGVDYGNSKGQIGATTGETFWAAARQIVSECHKILKPGGHAIWVVKAFVRKGKIVDFPGDWRRLCESQGFETVHEHHAMLVKETRHNGLFGTITEKKERKSFFRRLAEKKGSPKIDFEVILCMMKKEKCG